jgi:hypothetical protein
MTEQLSTVAPASDHDDRSIARLVSDLSEQTARLVRTEARLAAREMAGKARRAGLGAGALGFAGVLALYGGGLLLLCLVFALATVMPGWLAALLVGLGVLLIAGILALFGQRQLRRALPPVPTDTIARAREDIEVVTHP